MFRWRAQTTSPRHRITDIARKPRIAPTMMKTVPSGRLDSLMNGALAVGGTDGLTYPPARVGRPVSLPVSVADEPVMTGTVPVSEVVEAEVDVIDGTDWLDVVEGALVDEDWVLDEVVVVVVDDVCVVPVLDEALVVVAALPVEDWVVEEEERFGRPVDVDLSAAETATANRPTPTARDRENLMAWISSTWMERMCC